MFVQNCRPDFGQEMRVPGEARRRKATRRGVDPRQDAVDTSSGGSSSSSSGGQNGKYFAVKCDVCLTQVAVYDEDEVYHFFNVLASHS